MKYNVYITDNATNNLSDIFKYLSEHLLVSSYAANLLKKIEEQIYSLELFPNRHQKYQGYDLNVDVDLRMIVVNNFTILYFVDSKSLSVFIVSVFYSGRDIDKEINENI